ncbi:damage-inducible protein CinA [Bifidobacterium rousetti]|uniref:CinA family protein n=1 Tax=Bifidobacterium rousetti TaxID=2045439 RepID=UPI00123C47C6|nr:nicotinamide-nucleotide amidohydrolase family protein [Bifidobacterium rousetti]KAA8820366.1 damage-inducible protein CinA [Bifidobacterium rousetti]
MQPDTLAAALLRWCERRGLKIACAESLTGGLLADAFVRVPGASKVFLGSAVTYDIKAKARILGVDRALLEREGAVHPEVARQMAASTAHLYAQPEYDGAIVGLSTTGVAGPGPDGDKPAGLVYAGISVPAAPSIPDLLAPMREIPGSQGVVEDRDGRLTVAVELRLDGSREQVRTRTVGSLLRIVSILTGISQE